MKDKSYFKNIFKNMKNKLGVFQVLKQDIVLQNTRK